MRICTQSYYFTSGAYEDNLRTGCSQEHFPITIVDDRLYRFLSGEANIDEGLKSKCLLNTVSASDLVRSVNCKTKILMRSSKLLPYEEGFVPELGTEDRGEPETDSDMKKSWTWHPPARIVYDNIDEEAFGLTKLNPLTRTLQILRLPPFSRSLWGEMLPFVLKCCPKLKSLGRASGSMLGLDLAQQLSKEHEATFLQTNLEDIFMHLDLLNEQDYLEVPDVSKLEDGGVICQNSPNLNFLVHNFGRTIFEPVKDEDSESVFFLKEFGLEVWDYANSLVPNKNIEQRIKDYLRNICESCPKLRSLTIFCLAYIESVDLSSNTQLWTPLLNLKHFDELHLQMDHLIQFVGLIKCVGGRLKKISVTEMIGNRHQPQFSSEYEGLDLDEQVGPDPNPSNHNKILYFREHCSFVRIVPMSASWI